jgi:galactokinase
MDPVVRAGRALRALGREPVLTASAPGRVNLLGGHTDYNEGFVLPVAIDRRCAVALAPRYDGRLRVRSEAMGETVSLPGDAPPGSVAGWGAYVAGVAWALRGVGIDVGADLAIASDVPLGAGLSSSAALEVAAGLALASLAGTRLDGPTLARHCQRAENEFVGVDCGILDQYAAACGRRDHALLLDCRTLTHESVPLGRDAALVIVDTNVAHALADSAYNDRRAACERAVSLLDGRLDHPVSALRDVSPADLERHADVLPADLHRRARHVVTENVRVREAAAALRAGDLPRLGGLMDAAHDSLREDYEVSCPEVEVVVDLARTHPGVLGARLTGGGFGGSVVCLVRPDAVDGFRSEVETRFPESTGIDPSVFGCATDDGARLD